MLRKLRLTQKIGFFVKNVYGLEAFTENLNIYKFFKLYKEISPLHYFKKCFRSVGLKNLELNLVKLDCMII